MGRAMGQMAQAEDQAAAGEVFMDSATYRAVAGQRVQRRSLRRSNPGLGRRSRYGAQAAVRRRHRGRGGGLRGDPDGWGCAGARRNGGSACRRRRAVGRRYEYHRIDRLVVRHSWRFAAAHGWGCGPRYDLRLRRLARVGDRGEQGDRRRPRAFRGPVDPAWDTGASPGARVGGDRGQNARSPRTEGLRRGRRGFVRRVRHDGGARVHSGPGRGGGDRAWRPGVADPGQRTVVHRRGVAGRASRSERNA